VPLGIAGAASDDAEPCLAQLGAAPDVTPEAVALGVTLRQLMAQPSWTLEATVVMMHLLNGAVTIGPVRSLPLWLDHLPAELDAFGRLQEQGVIFEETYARCLAEQG
jgi:hypothetical protein